MARDILGMPEYYHVQAVQSIKRMCPYFLSRSLPEIVLDANFRRETNTMNAELAGTIHPPAMTVRAGFPSTHQENPCHSAHDASLTN